MKQTHLFNIRPVGQILLKEKFVLFLKCFGWSLLIKLGGGLAIAVATLAGLRDVTLVLEANGKLSEYYSEETSLFLAILLFPILEEMAFRGWLTKHRVLIAFSLTTTAFYLLYIVVYRCISLLFELEKSVKVACVGVPLLFVSVLIYQRKDQLRDAIERNWSRLIAISIFSFSAIHALNFNIQEFSIPVIASLCVILLPYPFSAYLYTYLRIRNGLLWSMALHVLNNLITAIPVFMGHNTI
jgi:membrane protease YdiL (CAAX protease family)